MEVEEEENRVIQEGGVTWQKPKLHENAGEEQDWRRTQLFGI